MRGWNTFLFTAPIPIKLTGVIGIYGIRNQATDK